MDMTYLRQEAEKQGIASSHYDIDGNLIYASPETLTYFTELLTQPTKQNKSVSYYDDVAVFFEHKPIQYDVTPLNLSNQSFTYQVSNEFGQTLFEQSSTISSSFIELPALDYGYYQLVVSSAGKNYCVRLLVSPKTAYQPPVLEQKKAWGLNVQLYSLRSQQNWGIGDFADLTYLIKQASQYGVDFIGINPLHLLYPTVPEWASPYSSSSRRWLNPIYLAVHTLPEFKLCKTIQNWFSSEEMQSEIEQLRYAELVDYSAITHLKLTALEQLFAFSKRSKSVHIVKRRQVFQHFLKQQGEPLLLQGLFNVLDGQSHLQEPTEQTIGWLGWCQEWQKLTENKRKALLKQHQEQVEFYAWLQWLAIEQLNEIKTLCQTVGMKLGIYGDLAVNSSRGSVDVWSDPELYFVNASVGAPPDPLGPIGQNWNLPPYNPSVLKARGFQPFIDMLRSNMQHFGILRIDHVMGLFRLWLIPEGKTAADGVYVHYPFDHLMAILAIESQRNQCLVVGEDLGTVPDEVRSKLNEFQIFSYFVLYFEQRNREYPAVNAFPLKAFSTIGTHDVPSLSSFWHCVDLQLFNQLGVLEGEVLQQKYEQRVVDKQALLDTLHRDNYLPAHYEGDALSMAMHAHLNYVLHQYLANSCSQLIGVQLENLLSQEISFNLPGTNTEYPNWRKKLACTLESMFSDNHITAFLAAINQARTV
ncbi:4-alpha-glucanotransferase [Pasteurella canis]|uniref:4-alpha-glucanotransferase n=1 Tax=Pasteurella canis TaxID=753 RepID=UPI001E582AB2|nr:4-alpha-glucanotransferase [Pasteurella canis]UEA17353.1 4-alpha-glucanotransferase [Pasteurella canis]